MLNIKRFVCNMFQENCYVVNDDTNECVIIDCGALYPEERNAMDDYIRQNALVPKHLICTHAHIDHNFGNAFIYDKYGLKPQVCAKDTVLMDKLKEQAHAFVGMNFDEAQPEVEKAFDEGQRFAFGNHTLEAILTPGHTPGSVFLYCEEERLAFSGDTLFRMSVGRTDFELGSYDDLIASLQKISRLLPHDTIILPGHDQRTTLEDEIRYNPYFR